MGVRIVNWINYISTTVAVFLFTLYYRQSFFLVLLLLLCALPVASYTLCRYGFDRVQVTLSSKVHTADKPATLPLFITIANNGFLPFAHMEITLLVTSSFYPKTQTEKLILPARARGRTEHAFPISYTKTGCYEARLISVCACDLLHLFCFSRTEHAQTEVAVLPRVTGGTGRHNAIYAEGFDEFEETSAKGNVSSNVTDVREYRPGDRFQKIHWKLTARTDELMVKENEATASNRFVVLMELYSPAYDETGDQNLLDKTFDHAFMLGMELLEAGESFFVLCYSMKQRDFLSFFIRDAEEFRAALARICYENPYPEENLGLAIYEKTHSQGTLLHVTHRGVDDVLS